MKDQPSTFRLAMTDDEIEELAAEFDSAELVGNIGEK